MTKCRSTARSRAGLPFVGLIASALGLQACAEPATTTLGDGNERVPNASQMRDPGFEIVDSTLSFEATLARAQAAIEKRNFKTFAIIDHAGGAASINAALNPTTLIIFGNPAGGTPLMQSAQTMGLDLPLKLLVYETATGDVKIAWQDMAATLSRHGVDDQGAILEKISGALDAIVAEAASNETLQ